LAYTGGFDRPASVSSVRAGSDLISYDPDRRRGHATTDFSIQAVFRLTPQYPEPASFDAGEIAPDGTINGPTLIIMDVALLKKF